MFYFIPKGLWNVIVLWWEFKWKGRIILFSFFSLDLYKYIYLLLFLFVFWKMLTHNFLSILPYRAEGLKPKCGEKKIPSLSQSTAGQQHSQQQFNASLQQGSGAAGQTSIMRLLGRSWYTGFFPPQRGFTVKCWNHPKVWCAAILQSASGFLHKSSSLGVQMFSYQWAFGRLQHLLLSIFCSKSAGELAAGLAC